MCWKLHNRRKLLKLCHSLGDLEQNRISCSSFSVFVFKLKNLRDITWQFISCSNKMQTWIGIQFLKKANRTLRHYDNSRSSAFRVLYKTSVLHRTYRPKLWWFGQSARQQLSVSAQDSPLLVAFILWLLISRSFSKERNLNLVFAPAFLLWVCKN